MKALRAQWWDKAHARLQKERGAALADREKLGRARAISAW